MGLISTEVEVTLDGKTAKYYEELGYEIPRLKNKWGKITTPAGTKIKVKTKDLKPKSGVKVDVECDSCHKKMKMSYSDYLRYNHDGKRYCNACGKSILLGGEKSPQWNPELTEEDRIANRNYKEYSDFTKSVLVRDNYTCVSCGKRGTNNLNVHHLNGYNWYKDADEGYTWLIKEL